MSDKYREVQLTLEDPTVDIRVSPYGSVTTTLHAHRVNNRGVTESYRIALKGVGVWELACVAKSAATALREKAGCDIEDIQGRLDYAQGAWNG